MPTKKLTNSVNARGVTKYKFTQNAAVQKKLTPPGPRAPRLIENHEEMKKAKPEVFLDHYLNTIGLWRKPVPKDGLSLFRAVSEQLFMTQCYHSNLYAACRLVFHHLKKDTEKEWTEYAVMEILSRMYRRDFLIYEIVGQPPVLGTFNDYEDKIVLCRVDENQLDSVYPITFQQSAAICQSVIYEILYRGVFKLDTELTEAVDLIRDQNKRRMSLVSNRFDDLQDTCIRKLQNIQLCFKDRQLKKPSPPLPYRIAKALDPYIYRNVELDIWEEEKRELKKESPEYRERFAAGDKCEVILGGCHYHGHIQEINDQENTAIVFIQELGEKKTVLISCLKTPPNRNYCSHYNRFFRRKQELAIQGQQHSEYSNYSSSKSPGYSSSYTSAEAGQQGYLIAAGAFSNNNTMTNANTGYVGMDTTPVQALDNANKNNLNQAAVPGVMQQYTPPMMAYQQQTNPYMYNNAVVPQQTYSCVCVPHLESIAVQAVNMNTGPSKDSGGKDLPEMNTLRFFYNLGVENYRLISTSSTSPPANPRWPPVEMNAVMPPNNMMMVDQMNGNTCGQFAGQAAPYTWCKYDVGDDNNTNANMSSQMFYYSQSHVPPTTCLPVCDTPGSASTTSKSSSSTSNSAMSSPSKNSEAAPSTVSSDEMADCNDSGCDSDSTGSANSDMFKEMDDKTTTAPDHDSNAVELEKKLDNYIAHVKDNEPESISTPIFQTPNTPKQKSKRKYYMYGNLKLVKPIKDIPPRYLKLLSNLNSEKHRCEGDPIIVPFLPPKPHYNKYNNNHNLNHAQTRCSQTQGNAGSGFNPEAKSFVPSNPVIHDPSIIACGGNVATDPSNGVHMYPNGVGVNSAYNCNVIYSHTGNNITGGSNINGVGNNSNQSTCSSPCSNNNTSTNPAGDGSMYCMPPSFSAGQACPYPGATPVQCPVYYTGAPQNCAVPPNQMAPGAYVPPQNCGVMPATMPMHTIQMT